MTQLKLIEFDIIIDEKVENYKPFKDFISLLNDFKKQVDYYHAKFNFNIDIIDSSDNYAIGYIHSTTEDKNIPIIRENKIRSLKLPKEEEFAIFNFFAFDFVNRTGVYAFYRGSISLNRFSQAIVKPEYKRYVQEIFTENTIDSKKRKEINKGIKDFSIIKKINHLNVEELLETLDDISSLEIYFPKTIESDFGSMIKRKKEVFR